MIKFKKITYLLWFIPAMYSLSSYASADLEQLLRDQHYQQFFTQAEQDAEEDDNEALFLLGKAYQLGLGVQKDNTQAKIYYHQAAYLGNRQANYQLGEIYFKENNIDQAITYYQLSFDNGNQLALVPLLNAYQNRMDYFINEKTAPYTISMLNNFLQSYFQYINMSYQQSPTFEILEKIINIKINLYMLSSTPKMLKQDTLAWLDKAIKQGSGKAMYYKAMIYQKDNDKKQAINWAKQAVEKQYLEAEFMLGELYPIYSDDSLYWYSEAMRAGNIDALRKLSTTINPATYHTETSIPVLEKILVDLKQFNIAIKKKKQELPLLSLSDERKAEIMIELYDSDALYEKVNRLTNDKIAVTNYFDKIHLNRPNFASDQTINFNTPIYQDSGPNPKTWSIVSLSEPTMANSLEPILTGTINGEESLIYENSNPELIDNLNQGNVLVYLSNSYRLIYLTYRVENNIIYLVEDKELYQLMDQYYAY